MRKIFIVTSVIEASNSVFSTEIRLTQTIDTIESISRQQPSADIIFVDGSPNSYAKIIKRINPKINYMHIARERPDLLNDVLYSPNKSIGEATLIKAAIDRDLLKLLDYDFIIKATGRYYYENLNDNYFQESSVNKFLFIQSKDDVREWNNGRVDYSLIKDLRYPDGKRHIFKTGLYALSTKKLWRFRDKLANIITKLKNPLYQNYDIENLLYNELLDEVVSNNIVNVDWKILGWCANGIFVNT
jgi:hypothetical protein